MSAAHSKTISYRLLVSTAVWAKETRLLRMVSTQIVPKLHFDLEVRATILVALKFLIIFFSRVENLKSH